MPRRTQQMFSMSRGKIRASMNKYNLFNLYKKSNITYQGKTLYQQKWTAKAETRAYHGEHLTEGRWKELFNPSLESVAQLDASLKGIEVEPTPLTLQTYANLEKRLEFAIFRAMFASSIRQARQFILGGNVQVNGIVIKHPSFPLRSGDVFGVSPEKVLLAMGRPKPSLERALKVDNRQIIAWNKYVKAAKENPRETWEMKQSKPKSLNTLQEYNTTHKDAIKKYNHGIEKAMIKEQKETSRESILVQILETANKDADKATLSAESFEVLGKQNAAKSYEVFRKLSDFEHPLVRDFNLDSVTNFISKKSTEFENEKESKLAVEVKQILSELLKAKQEQLRVRAEENKLSEDIKAIPFSPSFATNLKYHPKLEKEAILEDESSAQVHLPWQKGLFGRQDPSKPYFTPWAPRPFIGCFAILPSHIEVSFSTCHAVYLRDPVARPGHSEVITPFPDHVHERAYMYYARKGM